MPDKKVYAITDQGRNALDKWIASPDPKPRPLRDELFIRLAVMSTDDMMSIFDLLEAHQSIYLKKMSQLTKAKNKLKALEPSSQEVASQALVEELLMDAGLFHAEADIKWLEHCEAKLRAFSKRLKN